MSASTTLELSYCFRIILFVYIFCVGVAILDRPLYAVGGHDGWSYLNTVERYDPDLRQWSFVSPMSTSRSTLGVAVLNNKLAIEMKYFFNN